MVVLSISLSICDTYLFIIVINICDILLIIIMAKSSMQVTQKKTRKPEGKKE